MGRLHNGFRIRSRIEYNPCSLRPLFSTPLQRSRRHLRRVHNVCLCCAICSYFGQSSSSAEKFNRRTEKDLRQSRQAGTHEKEVGMRLTMESVIKWWQWLLIGAGFCVVAIITGPLADRMRYATFVGLIVSILASTACTVCWIVGIIRFAKWVWLELTGPSSKS
jgi:hypothetical protein